MSYANKISYLTNEFEFKAFVNSLSDTPDTDYLEEVLEDFSVGNDLCFEDAAFFYFFNKAILLKYPDYQSSRLDRLFNNSLFMFNNRIHLLWGEKVDIDKLNSFYKKYPNAIDLAIDELATLSDMRVIKKLFSLIELAPTNENQTDRANRIYSSLLIENLEKNI